MKRLWPHAWKAALFGALATSICIGLNCGTAQGREIGTRTSSTVVMDTGDGLGGFNVTITTASATLLSASGSTAVKVWRLRTFQVTGTTYTVWMSTHTGAYGTGAGWYVAGSNGSFTTRSQAAIYGRLDPSAGAGTAVIKGPYEYQVGEVPRQ